MPQSREPEQVSALQVAVHFTLGALLGTLGGLYLVAYDWSTVNQMLTAGAAGIPPMPAAVFVAICACTIATGASLTGVVFSTLEAERIADSRRRPPPPPPRDRG